MAMALVLQVRKFPLAGVVPSCVPISTALLQLVCFLLLVCSSQLKPCTCSTFNQVPGFLYLHSNPNSCTGWDKVSGELDTYIKTYYPDIDYDSRAFFLTRYSMPINGSSFTISFTMSSIYQSYNLSKPYTRSMFFSIQPVLDPELYEFYPFSVLEDFYTTSTVLSETTLTEISGSDVSTTIYEAQQLGVRVGIDVELLPHNSSLLLANNNSCYSVWVDYDHVQNSVLVYVGIGETASKPANYTANATLNTTCIMPQVASLGFSSSVGQLVQLDTLNTTIIGNKWNSSTEDDTWTNSTDDGIPPQCYAADDTYNWASFYPPRIGNHEKNTIILSSVFGSAAATAISAALVYFYFNSKQRRWKKEREKLTKVMQGLPGVPTQVDFADIKKATKNFHETMKLGRGGFGAVYRCTLPATASRMGQAMEVAAKKFMQGVEDRRYNDFLAEVSIINRLRHKNIVPLIGWSYNKGEPLLIYEYMKNGSLDQHIFERGGNKHQRNTDIFQWSTRYGIVRDIATGLHYVHNEHEPMVLHRDIKASNIMLDSNFRARLGDFGIACTVAIPSATGIAGTFGYMAPEYVITYKATRQTDIYAFGVLILEIITGKKNGDFPADESHITLWVRRLHREGKLLEAVDSRLLFPTSSPAEADNIIDDDARRLLLLGLACTNPNHCNRPTMAEVVQVINKLAPPPNVSIETPMLFGLQQPEEWPSNSTDSDNDIVVTATEGRRSSTSSNTVELVKQPMPACTRGDSSVLVNISQASKSNFNY